MESGEAAEWMALSAPIMALVRLCSAAWRSAGLRSVSFLSLVFSLSIIPPDRGRQVLIPYSNTSRGG